MAQELMFHQDNNLTTSFCERNVFGEWGASWKELEIDSYTQTQHI